MDVYLNDKTSCNTNKGNSPAYETGMTTSAPPSGNLKVHKLQNTWILWFINTNPNKSWKDMILKNGSFNTVEDFWSLYYRTEPPSKLKNGSDYMLFKENIPPMWEDPVNKNGGRWLISINQNLSKNHLDIIWLDVLLCLIGEACDNCDEICGAAVRIRKKNNKIAVWTKNGNDEEAILEIGHKLHELVRLEGTLQLQYQHHFKEEMGSDVMHILKVSK
ncbi:eukaryotic translation initiation factor 4E1 [Drosophila eugracilis]|uniref:eukaryotic translation initiation factor 4E1 n=1 Tax=Drosophila eugracilis TaxID=29029 RepID=UPI0007E638F0|nr:eukaryotic translation initiation factor 4E1 [Drosophila eugracilis]